jgi:hypothetical protein
MPLKDSTETKRWAVKKVEEVGWVVRRKRGELPILGSPIIGFPRTTRILRMRFQLGTFCFEILRRVALWRAQYSESCKLCSGGAIAYRCPLW